MLFKTPRPVRLLAAALSLSVGVTACEAAPPNVAEERGPQLAETSTTRGLDQAGMARTLEAAAQLTNLRSLIVMRHGEELVARRFNGGAGLDQPVNIKSASKSVLSAMIGIAIERGVLEGTEQTVLPLLADFAPSRPAPQLDEVTVGNLLSMQSGLERTSGGNYGRWVSSDNWVRYALSQPFVAEPGGPMQYSTGNSHILSAMLTEASGRSTYALAQDWLAGPLDVAIPPWEQDPQGIYLGGNQMAMSPRALARFGEMYRRGGVHEGERILSEDWIARSWTPATVSPWSGEQYGLGWFIAETNGHPLYYAWGYGGQMVYIVPDLALTVVMTSATDVERGGDHIGRLRALLDDGIVPAAQTGATR